MAIGGPHRTVAATRGGPSLFKSATLIRSPATLLVTTSSIVPVDPHRCRSPRRFSTALRSIGMPVAPSRFFALLPFPLPSSSASSLAGNTWKFFSHLDEALGRKHVTKIICLFSVKLPRALVLSKSENFVLFLAGKICFQCSYRYSSLDRLN